MSTSILNYTKWCPNKKESAQIVTNQIYLGHKSYLFFVSWLWLIRTKTKMIENTHKIDNAHARYIPTPAPPDIFSTGLSLTFMPAINTALLAESKHMGYTFFWCKICFSGFCVHTFHLLINKTFHSSNPSLIAPSISSTHEDVIASVVHLVRTICMFLLTLPSQIVCCLSVVCRVAGRMIEGCLTDS